MRICTISLCLSFIINFLQKLEKTFFENNDMAGNSQNYCLKLNPDTVRIMNSEIMECGISLYFTKSKFFGKCIFFFQAKWNCHNSVWLWFWVQYWILELQVDCLMKIVLTHLLERNTLKWIMCAMNVTMNGNP